MDYGSSEDAALVAASKAGDIDAFETLVRRHARLVYAHALRFFGDPGPVEDVVQEVFVKVYRSLASFDERSAFTTWLYRVTRNACLDEVRTGRRRPVPVDTLEPPGVTEDFADGVALSDAVEHAMRALPPEDRDALSAVSLFGLSYAEAAALLDVPVGTVKSRVFRARRALAVTLELAGGDR